MATPLMSEYPSERQSAALADDLLELLEWLAQRAHENWARQRLADGWRYGPQRDDVRKEHPTLVPYAELPEVEKAYDRLMCRGTLEAVLGRGYRIEPPPATSGDDADQSPATASSDERTAEWYCRSAEQLLAAGQPLDGYDVTQTGLRVWPRHLRLRQLQAMALARSGAGERAMDALEALRREGHLDEETLGSLARLHKDWGLNGPSTDAVRRDHLEQAEALYTDIFRRLASTWGGINAATLRELLGDLAGARELAGQVADQARSELAQGGARGSDTYWSLATLGEAALISGKPAEAANWYGRAAAVGRGRYGDIASTRRNARLLLDVLPERGAAVESALRVPTVATIVAGAPGGVAGLASPLASEAEEALRQRVRRALADEDCRVAYVALATSADIVTLEVLAEAGGETHVVLSGPPDRFVPELSAAGSNVAWRTRCEAVLRRAQQVVDTGEQLSVGFTSGYARRLALGLARMHAARLDTRVVVIDLADPAAEPTQGQDPGDTVVAILFADVPRFTRLSEAQLPLFVEHLLGTVGLVAASYAKTILTRNTWGDGLYFIFSTTGDAGRFALELSDRLATIDWRRLGLPADLGLRIALHAGPAYRFVDPVTGAVAYTGPHVSRAARLEPITPPRHVYASEAFAALAAVEAPELQCDYVGRTSMAKAYGVFPTYHLRRATT